MPLTTLTLAAIPTKFIAIPVAAALLLGTGATGAYLAQPTPVSASVITVSAPDVAPAMSTTAVAVSPVAAPLPCAQQTWPYLTTSCAAEKNAAARAVRVVMTPRQGEATAPVPAPQAAIEEANKSLALVSRDTVLRAPELVTTPKVAAVKQPRVTATREPRRERRFAAQTYQVPTEFGDRSRAVMVVRPLRTGGWFD